MEELPMDTNKPVQTLRDGAVGASIWLKNTRAGVFYDVTFSRAWSDEESGKSGYSQTFSDRYLDSLINVAEQAKQWIAEKKDNAETVTVAA